MTLSIPAFVPSGSSAEATLVKSAGEEDWPAELEQNIICYTGRGDTEYPKSMTPPSAEGTYMAEVRVGPRYLVSTLTAASKSAHVGRRSVLSSGQNQSEHQRSRIVLRRK